MVSIRVKYQCDYICMYSNNKNTDIIIVRKRNITKAHMRNTMKRKIRFLIKFVKQVSHNCNYTVIVNKFHDIKLDEYKKIRSYITQCVKKKY